MYKLFTFTLLLLIIFSFSSTAMDLDNFSISATLYPNKLPDSFSNGWLFNSQEWLSVSVDFTVNLWQGLYFRSDTVTYMFATNGINFAPSSTKFVSEFGYKFENIQVKYRHYCHHYFHQFKDLGEQQDRLIFEYSF